MPNQDFRDVAYPQEVGDAFVYLVVIDHDDIADGPIRITTAQGEWNDTLETYIFTVDGTNYISSRFTVIPPGQSDEEPDGGRLIVPNVDWRIGEAIEQITSPATVSVTAVLESDPTVVVGGPYEDLLLSNVRGNDTAFEGELTWPALITEPWPYDWIRPAKFIAAFRSLG